MNTQTELRILRRLQKRVAALVEIVEGASSVRWDYCGERLKDTKEWCAVYVAHCDCEKVGQ